MSSDDITIIGPGWADNIKLDTLDGALQINSNVVSSMQGDDPDDFWATVPRYSDDLASDVMEFSFASERLVNHIRFEVAKFPHTVILEYFDLDSDDWLAMFDADHDDDEECERVILDCVPSILPPDSSVPPGNHPQHSFSGHWERCEWVTRPRRCQKMRLRLKRHRRSYGPRNSLGDFLAYSLAIRNMYCGYKVDSFESVPRPKSVITSYTEHESFATSKDLLGSSLSYSIRINRAENILHNDSNANSQALTWMSEPQPFPWAVVNFYMDVRDTLGNAQTLDRFFLDPITEGPHVNLYYSNQEPDAAFDSADYVLSPQVAVINGTISGAPLSSTTVSVGTVVHVDIDNIPICYNPRRRWWKGCHLNWKFSHHHDHEDDNLFEDSDEHPIYDCGEWHLAWTRHGLRFGTRHGDYCYVDVDDFYPNDDFKCFVWHDGNNNCYVRIRSRDRDYHGYCYLTVPFTDQMVSRHRVGGSFDVESRHGDFFLHNMCLKIDEDVVEDLIEDFFKNTIDYCVKPEFAHDDNNKTKNAILRYYPGFISNDFPSGFKGGGPTRYDNITWSPIARDYRLTKGFLQFAPTKAKYWKMEFCDLTPQSYEVYIPIKKTVQTYKTSMWNIAIPKRALQSVLPNLLPGFSVNVGVLATINRFQDFAYVSIGSGAAVSVTGQTNTMARVITDQVAARILGAVSWAWNFMPCHRMTRVPVFETECVHTYDEIKVQQTTKIAYFVGLKSVQPYRVDYLSTDDTAQYIELFQDQSHLNKDSGWILEADHSLSSGGAQFAQVQSQVLSSSRVVRAVQYATTQSAPIQLLPDDDFDDPTHANWVAVGDGSLASTTQNQLAIGSTLRVDRSSRVAKWSDLGAQFSTWGAIAAQNYLFGAMEGSGNPGQALGGIESASASTPPGGRIYAAARVVAPAALSSPLYVQIVDALTGTVLSESSVTVPAGQVTEWHTSYTVGDSGLVLAWRWNDFAINPRYTSISDNFSRVDAVALGTTSTGQPWFNNGTNHTIASVKANTPVAGAFDYVNGGSPWGTFSVAMGTMAGTGQTYAQLIDFRPITMDDQGVIFYRGTSPAAFPTSSVLNRAVQAGDVVRVDVLPTALVPSGLKDTRYTDNVSAPYSLVFYLNGTWIQTIAHRLGALSRRGIFGRLNQLFTSFSWLPAAYGALPGPVIVLLPIPSGGNFSADRFTWTDYDNFVWSVNGSWDNVTVANNLVAMANGSKMIVDTGFWYGTISANVRGVATGTTGFSAPHGSILSLDEDHGIYLDALGNVVKGTTIYANLIPGGVAAGSFVQVSFLDTASVASSISGAISATSFPRMLVARVNGTVVGTLGTSDVQTWTGTRRGLCGDVYNTNGGALPGGSVADFNTSFTSFAWAPDASVVVIDPSNPTWNEITQRGTATYDSASHHLTLHTGQLKARVVQRQPSLDIWDMDTLSMFADPIVWSFSNDGGVNFYNVFDIRNNPSGVFIFPDSQLITTKVNTSTIPVSPGQALVWRAVSYAPKSKISSLTIRPWYGGILSGITHRVGLANGGPNVMPYDDYPAIENDARFQVWSDPIPQDWYYQFRIINRSKDVTVIPAPVIVVSDALNSTYQNGV